MITCTTIKPKNQKKTSEANEKNTVTVPEHELQTVFDRALERVREISQKYKIEKDSQ